MTSPSPSTHPLRERLAAAAYEAAETWYVEHGDDRCDPRHSPVDGSNMCTSCRHERTAAAAVDALLPVFAAYLREQAAELQQIPEGHDQTGATIRVVKAAGLLSVADSISPEATP